jgi:diaminopropionate ammonia-lyase
MDDSAPVAVLRPAARRWTCGVSAAVRDGEVRAYHASLPGYAPTPLAEIPALAAELGSGRVFVKDESARLGLPAFKVLGASWAVRQVLAGPGPDGPAPPATPPPGLAGLRELAARWPGLVFVTATDGNHGRAVARMARLSGVPARVFIPAVTEPATRAAIAAEGAEVTQVAGSYDEAIAAARDWAGRQPAAALVQDTGWPGYEQVPGWIVDGYSTLFAELDAQLAAAGAGSPALVAVPVGVGSLAQAAVTHYRSAPEQGGVTAEGWPGRDDSLAQASIGRRGRTAGGWPVRGQNSAAGQPPAVPSLLSVEPDTAACLLASLRAGTPVTVPTAGTIMAGLNCGTVSSVAWPYLAGGLDAAVAVTDSDARRAAADLAASGISSGPSGAASLAGVRAVLTGKGSTDRRAALAVDSASVIILLSTEAGTAG